jgi:hypothetical protein
MDPNFCLSRDHSVLMTYIVKMANLESADSSSKVLGVVGVVAESTAPALPTSEMKMVALTVMGYSIK